MRRIASIRSILVRLVAAALVPGVLAASVVLLVGYRNERAQFERDTIQTARALMLAVDAEFARAQATAQTLSRSAYLASGDLAKFHGEAKAVIDATGVGNNFVLSEASGQQLVNTVRSFPGPLPRHGNPDQLRRVFEAGRPVISDIYLGGVLHRPVMSIDIPVVGEGRIKYDLSVGLFPERLVGVLQSPRLPADWIADVFDRRGVIAARTVRAQDFVGKTGPASLVEHMARTDEGIVETETLDGTPSIFVYSRSPLSAWTVAIAIPKDVFAAPLRERFLILLGVVAILFSAGIAVAWVLAGRLARSIRALTAPALALGSGRPVTLPVDGLREAAEVAEAIGKASDLLQARNRELDNAYRELQDFSYAISHDLRTPVRAIGGFARIVEEDYCGRLDGEALRLLGEIRGNAATMGRLIDGLIDFMQMSRHELSIVEVDVGRLARTVFERLRDAAPERRLKLRIGDLPSAWADRMLLRRVLENLLGNAVKFIPAEADGLIVVTGESAGGETVYHVADNGVGFDMRYTEKLFKVFERLHPRGEFEGVGIGLAVAKRIIGRHGGRIWAEGEVGKGAIFHFALPQRRTTA